MKGKKSENVSFADATKETLIERIQELIQGRSIRSVSIEWGLPYSTLNNYLNKGTDPSFKAIQTIAEAEQVSLDWLAFGINKSELEPQKEKETPKMDRRLMKNSWDMVYESLSTDEISELLKAIHRKGIEGILKTSFMNDDSIENSIERLQIRPTLKQAIKLAIAGDESIDREILRRIEEKKDTGVSGELNQDENHSKAG
ncbi:helix-turn-helix transcriptional regulator [Providencia zhijiangensis]|uniref:Helix-turn-helix transcriptional regulator n=1 Tax=Providencia zhijiangensis TaxID=3053982 RepID=A0ABZ0MY21_9GAMM|nr:helix-turn-helix transcriptional regulator [Providencia sp. D4759]WPA91016.1 helix-turn-helix transcriptional regulator [Providencia sp. D4759]